MTFSLIAPMTSSLIQTVDSSLINAISGKENGKKGRCLPLLAFPLMMKVLGKEVTRAVKGYI